MKSILLSSSRGDLTRHARWMKLEAAKGLIPAVIIAVAAYLGAAVPYAFLFLAFACGAGWAIFVLCQATVAALRLNQKHAAYMRAVGVDLNLGSVLSDRRLWRTSTANMTMREFIAVRRAPKTSS